MINFICKHQTAYYLYLPNDQLEDSFKILKKYLDAAFNMDISISKENKGPYLTYINKDVDGVGLSIENNNVILYGHDKYGSYDAIMEFLSHYINLEIYAKTCIKFKKKASLIIKNEYYYVPSFKYRIASYGFLRTDESLKRMTHLISNDELFITGNNFHNAFYFMQYGNNKLKDEYLSDDKKQLAFSNSQVREIFVSNVNKYLFDHEKDIADKKYLVLGMEDNLSWASSISNLKNESDEMIDFINFVEEKINKNRKNKIIFLLFSYYHTLKAPINKKCNDNVGVIFAPIKARFRHSFAHLDNKEYLLNLNKWSTYTNYLFAWTYNFYTRRNFITYDTFSSLKENYQLLKDRGVKFLYDQTESYSFNQTGFSILKAYLQTKLLWNTSLDINKLIKYFFINYYQEAAIEIYKIFKTTLKQYKALYKKENIDPQVALLEENADKYSEIGQRLNNFKCFKSTSFKEFIFKTNNEFKKLLKKYQSNETLYQRLLLESVQYKYLGYCLKRPNKKGFQQFLTLLKEVGITHYKEGGNIGENIMESF